MKTKRSRPDLQFIRALKDFDLIMLISEVHDHGWPMAKRTLDMMKNRLRNNEQNEGEQMKRAMTWEEDRQRLECLQKRHRMETRTGCGEK